MTKSGRSEWTARSTCRRRKTRGMKRKRISRSEKAAKAVASKKKKNEKPER
jgi:hypothetical protein